MKITQDKIIYDSTDWLGDIDNTNAGSANRKLGNGLAFSQSADPLRRTGYISPGFNPSDVSNVAAITAYLRNAVINGQNALMIESDGKVQMLGSLTATPAVRSTAPFNDGSGGHNISDGHASYVGLDIVNYYTASTFRGFYSFSDGTDWNVGIYNWVAETFDDDFMSTVPATPLAAPYITGGKSAPHPLIVADDDILYIGDRNFVHAYDGQTGANGTFTAEVLTLPKGFIITSFAKTSDRKLAIAGYLDTTTTLTGTSIYLGQTQVWIWNLLDLDPDFAYDLHDNYVSEIKNWRGTIAAFTVGRPTSTYRGIYKLQVLNNGEFEVAKTWSGDGTGYGDDVPIRGGVETVGDDIYWNSLGVINSFTKDPNGTGYIHNKLTDGTGSTTGMLKIFTSASPIKFFLSSGATTSGGLQTLSSDYNEAASVYGKTAVPLFPKYKRGRLKSVTITFLEAVSGGRELQLVTNLDKTATVTIASFTTVTNMKVITVDTKADGTELGDFSSIQPQFTWATGSGATVAPTIDSLIYEFETINIDVS